MTSTAPGAHAPARLGLVGLGVISEQYLATLRDHPGVHIVAVADLRADRAAEVAAALPACRASSPEELLAADDIDLVINLTVPAAHADIARAAIAAGTAVFGEKPLATSFADASLIIAEAGAAGVAVGSAPDTVLGTGVQTARAAVEAGLIGTVTAASATWVSPGHERWHPHPDFYYRDGGGPLFDMGPYYLTSLVHLLGPVVSVVGEVSRGRAERVIGSGPRAGERIPVEVDTHVTGVLRHASGALSTVAFSFDAAGSAGSPIEVHGETGSLAVPDPNYFDGVVRHLAAGGAEWTELPASAGYAGAGRGIGVIDMLRHRSSDADGTAVGTGRASGSVALHVTEIMTAIPASARTGRRVMLESTAVVPPLVPLTPEDVWRRA